MGEVVVCGIQFPLQEEAIHGMLFTFPPRWYLFIYSHLHAFELLGWQGAGTKQQVLTPSHGFDLTKAGLLTLQHTKASVV